MSKQNFNPLMGFSNVNFDEDPLTPPFKAPGFYGEFGATSIIDPMQDFRPKLLGPLYTPTYIPKYKR